MIERIFENWLTKASERSFQLAYVQLLIAEGHEIVHISTHGAGEHGKDIISKDGDGKYHAFQLKATDAKDLTKAEWRKMRDEVYEVSEVPIEHPSIPAGSDHVAWFVINSGLTPDVFSEIEMRNRDAVQKGKRTLGTDLKGQISARLLREFKSLLPEEPKDFHQFLGLYLANGKGPLDKEKFAHLIASALPEEGEISKKDQPRKVAGATLLALYALNSYFQEKNWVSVIDGLVITIATILRWSAKRNLPDDAWKAGVNILMDVIETMFVDLQTEVLAREEVLTEGNVMVDQPYYAYRVTKLFGYLAGWEVFRFLRSAIPCEGVGVAHILTMKHSRPFLWGEAVIPQLACLGWLHECKFGQSHEFVHLLEAVVRKSKTETTEGILPSPYYSETQVLDVVLGFAAPFGESFVGRSFSMRSLIDAVVRRNQRAALDKPWKDITHIYCVEFKPKYAYDYLSWHIEESGQEDARFFANPQSWAELVRQEDRSSEAPDILSKVPHFLPLFLLVYPHRFCPPIVALADKAILKAISS